MTDEEKLLAVIEEARDILSGAFDEESAKEWYFGIRDALSVLEAAL